MGGKLPFSFFFFTKRHSGIVWGQGLLWVGFIRKLRRKGKRQRYQITCTSIYEATYIVHCNSYQEIAAA